MNCKVAFNPLKSIHPLSRYHVCFVPFQVGKSPFVLCHLELFSLSQFLHLQMKMKENLFQGGKFHIKNLFACLFSVFPLIFLYPRLSIEFFSCKQQKDFALCIFVFVYISAITIMHNMQICKTNQAVEEKYVLIGLSAACLCGVKIWIRKGQFSHILIHPITEC